MAIPGVLRVPAYRRVWLGSLASNAGSWLHIVASGYLVYQLTDSPAAVGGLALVARAPAIALSTVAGHLADRHDRRRVGIATFLLQAAAAAVLAALTWAGGATVVAIYAATFAMGVGFALGLPAMLALVPSLVDRARLPQAVSLNAAGINVARLVGPAIGGVALPLVGAGWCFALNGVSFLALVGALATVRTRAAAEARAPVPMRQALRHAGADPAIRRLLIGMAVFTGLASPVQELAPVVADRLEAGPEGLGLLLGAMGGGALVGAYSLDRLEVSGFPRHRSLPLATLAFSLGMAAVAVTPWLWAGIAAMAFSGAFWIWMFAATNTAIQLNAPPALLGRMLGLYQLAVIGPIAIGSIAVGGLAERVGISASLGLAALLLAAWGAWSLRNAVPAIDAPPRAPAPGPRAREGGTGRPAVIPPARPPG